MKNNRKAQILEKITQYTQSSIADGSFSFEQCNAFYLALDLKLERSNVSRILNQLFNDLLFIKINGRPTTFLSRDVLVNEYPYAQIPQVLSDLQALKNCLFPSQTKGSHTTSFDFDIIGTLPNEALKDVTDKTLPFILYPQSQTPLIILSGEKGCGKKHFCEQLFAYAVKKHIFSEKEQYIALNYHGGSTDNYTLLDQINPDTVAMILLEVFQEFSAEDIYGLNSDIRNLYGNRNRRQPVIFLLLDHEPGKQNTALLSALSPLTPCIVRFPSLAERTTLEKIKLILSFIQEAADQNQVQIHISSELLPVLSTFHYEYNVFELHNEINYAISLCLYFSKSDSIVLSIDNFSENISRRYVKKDYNVKEASTLMRHSLPPFIDFHPGKPCTVLEYLTSSQANSIIRLKPLDFIQELARKDVLAVSPSLEEAPVSSQMERLVSTVISKSALRFDTPLRNRLYALLEEMVQKNFHLQNISEKPDFSYDTVSTELCLSIVTKLEYQYRMKFSNTCKVYLHAFLHYALLYLQKSNIIYLIAAHQTQLPSNYAQYLNYISESRSYYCFDYTLQDQKNYDKYIRRLSRLIRQLDTSREFVLFSDKAPLSTIAKSITSSLNVVALSIHPFTLPMMVQSAVSERSSASHAVSMFRKLLSSKMEDAALLERVITRYPDNYIVSSLGTYFDSFFEQNNTILVNRLLFDILKAVGHQLSLELKAGLVLDFFLHGNFMIARSIEKKMLDLELPAEWEPIQKNICSLLKEKLDGLRELHMLNISEQELYVMSAVICKYLDQPKTFL